MTLQNENDFELIKYRSTAHLAIFAQVATVLAGITIGILIYLIDLPVYYLSCILLFQLLVIPNVIANSKILKQKKRRREDILTRGIRSNAEIISAEMLSSGGDIDNYYTFELRPELSDTNVIALEALTSETYYLVCRQGKVPVRYLPTEQVAVILVDELTSE